MPAPCVPTPLGVACPCGCWPGQCCMRRVQLDRYRTVFQWVSADAISEAYFPPGRVNVTILWRSLSRRMLASQSS
eukprot:8376489-Pyramimonas_sp.AAC.1